MLRGECHRFGSGTPRREALVSVVPRVEGKPAEGAFPYRDRVEDLRRVLVQQGSLGLLLIDTSALAQIEHQYGSSAFAKVMAMARDLVFELRGHEVRHDDIICLNDRGGDAFLVFFSPKRREGPLRIADLEGGRRTRREPHQPQADPAREPVPRPPAPASRWASRSRSTTRW